MDEDVLVAAGADARFGQNSAPSGGDALDGRLESGHAQGNVVQTGAAFAEKLRNRAIGTERFEKFQAGGTGGQHGDMNTLGGDGFTSGFSHAEGALIEAEGFVDIGNGDTEVVDRE